MLYTYHTIDDRRQQQHHSLASFIVVLKDPFGGVGGGILIYRGNMSSLTTFLVVSPDREIIRSPKSHRPNDNTLIIDRRSGLTTDMTSRDNGFETTTQLDGKGGQGAHKMNV
jgi:hypothetical protein